MLPMHGRSLISALSALSVAVLCAGCPSEEDDVAPPLPAEILVGPEVPRTGDDLVLTIAPSTDTEGDFERYEISWRRNGQEIADLVDLLEVSADHTSKGEAWSVWVTAVHTRGESTTFVEVVIANTPPTPPAVAIEPAEPNPGQDDLRCLIVTEGEDADADPLTYLMGWRVDGDPFKDTETSTHDGDTVPAEDVEALQTWSCSVASSDGTDASAEAVASLSIGEGRTWVADFSLPDVNETSATFGLAVSPRDYLKKVSGWYFGHST
jgi:hypothetical protein